MEKQWIFYATTKKRAETIAKRLYAKEGSLTHTIKILTPQTPTTWLLVLEECEKKKLTMLDDLSFIVK